ncbi:MAG: arsenite efflux transporter metallochaperone ArsD [Streptosporangiaceae bacterium]
MPVIKVYEPALCCSTGVCGPDLDQALVIFTADVGYLRGAGADISRHNLASDPAAFAGNDAVRSFLEVAGSEGLPLTMVDGVTVATGRYPARDQLLRYAGLASAAAPAGATDLGLTAVTGDGCGPAGCC